MRQLFSTGNWLKNMIFPAPDTHLYPTAVQFTENFKLADYKNCVNDTNSELIPKPLSLYFHLPFCDTVCYYCACNKIITKNKQHATPYLENLNKEIKYQGTIFDGDRLVEQLHWQGRHTDLYTTSKDIRFDGGVRGKF